MSQPLCLENLPRTVELERDGDGRPRLAYVDQRRLPGELASERTGDWRVVVDAVKSPVRSEASSPGRRRWST